MERYSRTNDNANNADNNEYIKSQEIIDSYLSELLLFEIEKPLVGANTIFKSEYIGGTISSGRKGILKLGICLKKNAKFPYRENSRITMAYPANGRLYLFSARIVCVHEAAEEDLLKINALFHDRLDNLEKILGPIEFVIADACVLTEPMLHQRRRYERSNVKWNVYFKLLRPNKDLANMQKLWISEKIFEFDRGYFKTKTVDVSSGGFKSRIKAYIPKGTNIECIMEIKMREFKAIGRIAGRIVGCSPSHASSDLYDMRVQFLNLSDSIKSAMILPGKKP